MPRTPRPPSGPKAKQKAPPHAWKPGQSGNPSGRPKTAPELKARLAEGGQKALEHVIGILDDAEADVKRRDWAAGRLMDFTLSKPAPSNGEKKQTAAEVLEAMSQALTAPEDEEPKSDP